MKKEFEIGKNKVVVENGSITIGGKLAHKRVRRYQIKDISDAPKRFRELIKENNAPTEGRVYVEGGESWLLIQREIAEEAAKQYEEIEAATDPNNIIEGYRELKAAYSDVERYHRQFNKMMDDEYNDGANPPKPVKADPEEIARKYLKMEGWANSSSATSTGFAKSQAGEKAVKRLVEGDDIEEVLAEAEAALKAAVNKAIMYD